MKRTSRIFSLLLALLTVAAMTACGDTASPSSGGTAGAAPSGDAGNAETESAVTEAPYPEAPDADLDGYTFRIAQGEPSHGISEKLLYVEEQTGDAVLDAIYNRNSRTAEKLNCTITPVTISGFSAVKNAILAGDDFAEIAMTVSSEVFPVLNTGMFRDLDSIPTIDLSHPWWDQNALTEIDLCGHHYALIGDLTTTDEFHTVCVIYSCNLWNDFGFDSPYGMVTAGTWTLDKFLDYATTAAADIDGDGKMGENDRWGFTTESAMIRWLSESFGMRSFARSGDTYTVAVDNERNLAVMESVLRLATAKEVVTFADDGTITAGDMGGVFYNMEKLFSEDLALFHSGTFDDLTRMRAYESDYGIIPHPKFNEQQDTYYHSVSWSAAMPYVPATANDVDSIGIVLENLGRQSHDTLTPVFYDLFMSEKLSRDEESKAMLDIIYSTLYYDFDDWANLTGLRSMVASIAAKKVDTFASDWAAASAKAETKLADYFSVYADTLAAQK